MSYNYKTTLIFLVLILLLTITGIYFTMKKFRENISQTLAEIEGIDQNIALIPELESNIDASIKVLDDFRYKLSKLDKRIVIKNRAVQVYSYLDSVQDKIGFVEFSAIFDQDSVLDEYSYKSFSLKGLSTFNRVFNLIWAIERGPMLLIIKSLEIRSFEEINSSTGSYELQTSFDMQLWAVSANLDSLPPIDNRLEELKVPKLRRNPFYPYVAGKLPANTGDLIELEDIELKAILPGRIFVTDNSGDTHVLKIGDRVYLGYLSKIDRGKNQAEFTMNKGGLTSKHILKLSFGVKE